MKEVKAGFFESGLEVAKIGESVSFRGCINSVKQTKYVSFVVVTFARDVFQIVLESSQCKLRVGMSIQGRGVIVKARLTNQWLSIKNREVKVQELEILSEPSTKTGIDWSKKVLKVQGEAFFDQRPVSLRHEREKAIFYIQNILVESFRDTLRPLGFIEMRTPKISAQGAEGGANVFVLEYFGKRAFLSQSPQFYKEYGTGIFQKVFEIGPVFRAEKHNTSRHLNEYNSMDVEFGPIGSFQEVMELEVLYLQNVMKALEHSGVREQAILEFTIPKVSNIPSLTFSEAKEILEQRGIKEATDDFSPNEEKELSRYVAQEGGGEFVFITHYPISARPFYTATEECPYSGELMTSSFDLLFRGVEITTGGQRIHDSKELEESMLKRGLDPVEFEFFAQAHRSGLPPHGGFGLGLERLTSQLIGVSSVKHCILYPRDTTRLSP